jgi:serine/threonine-protein kinase
VVAIRTVAVLPFANTGGDAKDEYFSDGLTDELAHALSLVPSLRLAGRTSSYAFKGKPVPAQAIGKALGVSGLVEGTVRRAGDQLRITAQLTSTDDGKVLWSGSYESGATAVFRLQDSVTEAIVVALAPALRGETAQMAAEMSRGTTDSVAYDLFLRGRYFWAKRGAANLHRALDYFKRSVTRDPSFARAHAGLGMVYEVLPGYGSESTDSMSALAMASGERALALDSTLSEAHVLIGQALGDRLRLRDAEIHFREALKLDPSNATARHWHALNLNGLGDLDSALAESRRAASLDPLSAVIASAEVITLVGLRRFPEAVARGRRALELDSTSVPLHGHLGLAYAFGGAPTDAVREFEIARRLAPDARWVRAFLLLGYTTAGQVAAADRTRLEIAGEGRAVSPLDAYVSALVGGDRSAALSAVERGLVPGGEFLNPIFSPGCHPILDPLRSEARFVALLRRYGMRACGAPTAPWRIAPR